MKTATPKTVSSSCCHCATWGTTWGTACIWFLPLSLYCESSTVSESNTLGTGTTWGTACNTATWGTACITVQHGAQHASLCNMGHSMHHCATWGTACVTVQHGAQHASLCNMKSTINPPWLSSSPMTPTLPCSWKDFLSLDCCWLLEGLIKRWPCVVELT